MVPGFGPGLVTFCADPSACDLPARYGNGQVVVWVQAGDNEIAIPVLV